MFFQPLTGPRPNRLTIHLDLTVPWGARSREVDRLMSVDATRYWDVLDEHPHVQWTTLADPESNLGPRRGETCLVVVNFPHAGTSALHDSQA